MFVVMKRYATRRASAGSVFAPSLVSRCHSDRCGRTARGTIPPRRVPGWQISLRAWRRSPAPSKGVRPAPLPRRVLSACPLVPNDGLLIAYLEGAPSASSLGRSRRQGPPRDSGNYTVAFGPSEQPHPRLHAPPASRPGRLASVAVRAPEGFVDDITRSHSPTASRVLTNPIPLAD